jgi:hypothetical protein
MKKLYDIIYAEPWFWTLPSEMRDKVFYGESLVLGNKIYRVCDDCHQLICVNKCLIGSVHVCG